MTTLSRRLRHRVAVGAAALALVLGAGMGLAPVFAGEALDKVVADVARDYDRIDHIPAEALQPRLDDPDTLVFDVREPDEYAVGHLPGAIRVDPRMRADAFMARFGDRIAGKDVVFYCSVGVRSSRLGERVVDAVRAAGADRVANLRGGIFGWHNEGRPVTAKGASTDYVHPYDRKWGRMVDDPDRTRYAPTE